ncbi:MAG: ABC transporter substrate-binding protein [Hyphomicrobiales bacterium]|nr:MAG: ABC transporter substrate-binding protein [Hyphomicrobiales bacterium]
MKLSRTTLALLASAFVSLGHAQPAAVPGTELVQAGALTYGTAATVAPFEYMENGKLAGFDIEMGALLAAQLKLEPKPMNMEFKGLIPALSSGRIDVINSAMYINDARKQQVDFVPYLTIGNEIVVRKGNPKKITGRDSVCGAKIAVTLGGFQETYARADAQKCKDAGKPAVEVMTFPTSQDSVLSLSQGRVDAFFIQTPTAIKLLSERPDVYEIAGETFGADTTVGLAVSKDKPALRDALTQALATINKNGSLAEVARKHKIPVKTLVN